MCVCEHGLWEVKVTRPGKELAQYSPLRLVILLQPSLPPPPHTSPVTHLCVPEEEKEPLSPSVDVGKGTPLSFCGCRHWPLTQAQSGMRDVVGSPGTGSGSGQGLKFQAQHPVRGQELRCWQGRA